MTFDALFIVAQLRNKSLQAQSDKGDFEGRAHMRARDCVWRPPSDPSGESIFPANS